MNPLKILVVEDDPTIAIDIALNLESNGFRVLGPTHNAIKAMEILEKKKPDLAILDINLPGEKSGIELAHDINKTYGIPFIFLTSYSDKDTVEEASKTFPATYIVKPFKEEDLTPAIQMAIAKSQANATDLFPSITLINKDLLSPITKTEYSVIEDLFVGLSTKEIAKKRFNSENTIKTHLKNLYSKIGVHNKMELINYLRKYL